jgi:hypothetical protein
LEYIDFELEVGPGSKGRRRTYPLAVLRSPAGEPRGSLKLPFDERGLRLRVLALENALLRSGATQTRRMPSIDEAPVQAIGQGLFGALLSGEVLSCYDQSQRIAREQRKGLRIKLRIQPPELASLPWEFLYDPREDEYMALSRRTPIVRYLESRQTTPALRVEPPLRILGVVASPNGFPELNVPEERRRVEDALDDLRRQGLVELVWLPGQTWSDLQEAMWRGPWNVFHFIGHGGFDERGDEGLLLLSDEQGRPRDLTATELARLLGEHDALRLAVLNACEGGRGGRRDVFSSSAGTLVRKGVPAVVAMQYAISDPAAVQFGTRFYAAIAAGMTADAALAEARVAMSVATRGSAEWGTPILYTNAPEVRLFDVTPLSAMSPAQPAGVATRGSTADDAAGLGASTTAALASELSPAPRSRPTNTQPVSVESARAFTWIPFAIFVVTIWALAGGLVVVLANGSYRYELGPWLAGLVGGVYAGLLMILALPAADSTPGLRRDLMYVASMLGCGVPLLIVVALWSHDPLDLLWGSLAVGLATAAVLGYCRRDTSRAWVRTLLESIGFGFLALLGTLVGALNPWYDSVSETPFLALTMATFVLVAVILAWRWWVDSRTSEVRAQPIAESLPT